MAALDQPDRFLLGHDRLHPVGAVAVPVNLDVDARSGRVAAGLMVHPERGRFHPLLESRPAEIGRDHLIVRVDLGRRCLPVDVDRAVRAVLPLFDGKTRESKVVAGGQCGCHAPPWMQIGYTAVAAEGKKRRSLTG